MTNNDEITSETIVGLLKAVKPGNDAGVPEWTAAVLGALRSLGETFELCVDPVHPRFPNERWSSAGEWLVDLALSHYPRYGQPQQYGPSYYRALAAGDLPGARPELALVAECEWGDFLSRASNTLKVLEDFVKLVALRAPLKVMVFSYHEGSGESSWDDLRGLLEKIARRSEDRATYVLHGVGWRTCGAESHTFHVASD